MLAYVYLLIAIAIRVLSGTGALATLGFTPLGASLLFFGSRKSHKEFLIAVLLVAASDLYLNYLYRSPLGADQLVIWAWYIGACFLGSLLKNRIKPLYVAGAAVSAAVSFFLVSNFAVWLFGNLYPKSFAGLTACYVAGLPFFRNGAISDLAFSAVFFGVPALVAHYSPATAEKRSTF